MSEGYNSLSNDFFVLCILKLFQNIPSVSNLCNIMTIVTSHNNVRGKISLTKHTKTSVIYSVASECRRAQIGET